MRFMKAIRLIFFEIICRISGNAASDKNIHGTVSEQLKKTFAKSRWKVRVISTIFVLISINEIIIGKMTASTLTISTLFD